MWAPALSKFFELQKLSLFQSYFSLSCFSLVCIHFQAVISLKIDLLSKRACICLFWSAPQHVITPADVKHAKAGWRDQPQVVLTKKCIKCTEHAFCSLQRSTECCSKFVIWDKKSWNSKSTKNVTIQILQNIEGLCECCNLLFFKKLQWTFTVERL